MRTGHQRVCKEGNGEFSVIRRVHEPRVIEISVREGVRTVRIELD